MVTSGFEYPTVVSAGSAWGREACRALALAEQRGLYIDREAIIHYDVRDLQRLIWQLSSSAEPSAWRRRWGRETLLARTLATSETSPAT